MYQMYSSGDQVGIQNTAILVSATLNSGCGRNSENPGWHSAITKQGYVTSFSFRDGVKHVSTAVLSNKAL